MATSKGNAGESPAERETMFRTLAESSVTGIIITQDDRFYYVNPAAAAMVGYQPEEMISLRFWNIIHPDHIPQFVEYAEKLRKGEQIGGHEFLALAKNGDVRWLYFSATSIELDGRPATLATSFDITERKWAEEALRASEERFRLLAQNVPGILYLCSNDERYTALFLNDRVGSFTGYSREDFLEDRVCLADLYHPDDLPRLRAEIDRALSEKRRYRVIFRMRHLSGEWRWMENFGEGVYAADRLQYLEGFCIDITERMNSEEAMRKMNEELKAAHEEALEAHLTKSRVLSDMSREFRAPIDEMIRHTETSLQRAASLSEEELKQTLNTVLETARHLLELVDGFDGISRK